MRLYILIGFFLLEFNSYAQTKYFSSFDDTKIAYTDEGKGKPILLIHGFIESRNFWETSSLKKELLQKGYRVITPDLRGNGDSDKPQEEDAYKLDSEVLDLMFLMVELRISKYWAIGYERGSILLARLMTKDRRLKKAVLGGMGIDFTNANWQRKTMLRNAFNGKPIKEAQAVVNNAKNRGADFKSLYLQQKYQPVTTKSQLAQIKIKVLVVAGDKDIKNGSPQLLHKAIPKSKINMIQGNHEQAYKTENFVNAILSFL